MYSSLTRRGAVACMRALAASCGAGRASADNPAILMTREQVLGDLDRMRRSPATCARPLVVLGGYHTWAPVTWALADRLMELTGASTVVCVSFPFDTSLLAARERAQRRILSELGARAREIDAVGISMGGIVARMLHVHASAGSGRKDPAIRIARLFTLAAPHRGAIRADSLRVDQASRDLRAGSQLLRTLDDAREQGRDVPELHCYAQLHDRVVGTARCAPVGCPLYWTGATRIASHFTTPHNPWFVCDIARRLRGEEPLFIAPHPTPASQAASAPTR